LFFNQEQDQISTINAISLIDDNAKGKGLSKKQDKYFTVTLNFSEKELKHIAKKISGRTIKNVNELSLNEYHKYNKAIRDYTKQAMKDYADNFNKDVSKDDVVWMAKIEHKRRYKGIDKEVREGRMKSGELKSGLHSHAHITVSRMHKDYRINLSPLTNARKSNNLVLNGKKIKGGFDRSNVKRLNEESFDKMFEYKRDLEEKFETLRVLKNGSFEEKQAMKQIIKEKEKNNEITL
jgi:hypothetical protein